MSSAIAPYKSFAEDDWIKKAFKEQIQSYLINIGILPAARSDLTRSIRDSFNKIRKKLDHHLVGYGIRGYGATRKSDVITQK